jgi:hypothetical protein
VGADALTCTIETCDPDADGHDVDTGCVSTPEAADGPVCAAFEDFTCVESATCAPGDGADPTTGCTFEANLATCTTWASGIECVDTASCDPFDADADETTGCILDAPVADACSDIAAYLCVDTATCDPTNLEANPASGCTFEPDPAESCGATCDPDACNPFAAERTPNGCACVTGDACCPDGCTFADDTDCPPPS